MPALHIGIAIHAIYREKKRGIVELFVERTIPLRDPKFLIQLWK